MKIGTRVHCDGGGKGGPLMTVVDTYTTLPGRLVDSEALQNMPRIGHVVCAWRDKNGKYYEQFWSTEELYVVKGKL